MESLGVFDLEDTKNDMLWEQARVKTFSRWPYTSSEMCTPHKMAAAGWYCTSTRNDISAKCAFCLKELNGWEPTDDPLDEHRKHSGNCAFLKLKKNQNEFTVEEMYLLLQERMIAIMTSQHKEDLKKMKDIHEKIIIEIDNISRKMA